MLVRAKKGYDRKLEVGEIFLFDSGGQYVEGTTDVTRTVCIGGAPTPEQKQAFTAVLKVKYILNAMDKRQRKKRV